MSWVWGRSAPPWIWPCHSCRLPRHCGVQGEVCSHMQPVLHIGMVPLHYLHGPIVCMHTFWQCAFTKLSTGGSP